MTKRGLNQEQIFEAAESLVQEKGYENFSLRELAARLEVRPASLYNHVQGLEEINTAVAMRAAGKLKQMLEETVSGKASDEAFLAGTQAYRQFAMEHPELYKAIVRMPLSNDEQVGRVAIRSISPLREIVQSYGLSKIETLHFMRGLRSVMHGFIELVHNGFMQRGPATQDETYEEIMHNYLIVLKEKAKKAEVESNGEI